MSSGVGASSEAPKEKGMMAQMSDGIDKGVHWGCETIQRGDWKSVALGIGMIALGVLAMGVLMPKMGIDFTDLNPSSIVLVAASGALIGLGVRGLFSPFLKNWKLNPKNSRILAIALAVIIPVALIAYGSSLTAVTIQHTGVGTNGNFWVGIILGAFGLSIGAAYLSCFAKKVWIHYKSNPRIPSMIDLQREHDVHRAASQLANKT